MLPNRQTVALSWRDWWNFSFDPRGPGWLRWLWTGVFCLIIALGITAVMGLVQGFTPLHWLLRVFTDNAIVSVTVGFTVQALHTAATPLVGLERLRRWGRPRAALYWGGIALLGVMIGWPLGLTLTGSDVVDFARRNPAALRSSVVMSLLLTVALFIWIAAKTARIEAERRATEARLRLLQAQIEPHFLFNTLANVVSLIDHDVPRARQMLEAFIDYLRASLGAMRDDESTLGAELDLADAYLRLLQVRMDDRLRYRIDVDAATRGAALPPLLLQPLVENAIHHGLEPKVDGGRIVISARREDDRLVLRVEDDGLGPQARPRLGQRPGAGVALSNVRERLAARYGSHAAFTLERRDDTTSATLALPYRAS